jgi:hypothetical protein
MTKHSCQPAKSIVSKIGVKNCAVATGKSVARVYRWMAPKSAGGTGGRIHLRDASRLIAFAQRNGIQLAHDEFFKAIQ